MSLQILGACFANLNVTVQIANLVDTSANTLTLNMRNVYESLPQTYRGDMKTLTILFRYSDWDKSVFLFAQNENTGKFKIYNAGKGKKLDFVVDISLLPAIRGRTNQIYAACYASRAIADPAVLGKLTHAMNEKTAYPVGNSSLGGDPWKGIDKFLNVYYGPIVMPGEKLDANKLMLVAAREYQDLQWS
ncbi:hypothetical protein B0T26DRAFT_143091 [Lasiosphaeria miniovina]|uniref:Uncharacterized protein n=1 Tax=Lasiosphaeria miniovina TaxID=1954250 RepID=A0AA40B4V3_9PEZI|nr:uncharacterized protein B0T26DRAFT_143091 [Lasiosphaeria miniovina]KAK0727710.1 hypothetical protein B0T26DRAFT_143091 [Lasiosphaeria miniovina]